MGARKALGPARPSSAAAAAPSVGTLPKRQMPDCVPSNTNDPSRKRRRTDAAPEPEDAPPASAAAPSPDDCMYVEMACEKAQHVIAHVDQHGCGALRLGVLVRDMGGTLTPLAGVSLEGLDTDTFGLARKRVELAIRDVAAFDAESLEDIELQGLICQLKMRLEDLSEPPVMS